jgi:DNA-binding transcriptional LysR family regulator
MLERELGVRLISRNTRGLAETDSGKLYYQHSKRILDEIGQVEAAVQSHSKAPTGELRVTAPVTFGRHQVAPFITDFLARYPRLSFYLSLSDHCESLTERRFDVAIRVAALREERHNARRLGYVRRAVVGSREYFEKHAPPRHPRELARHNCLHFTHYLRADEWNFVDQGRAISVRVRGRMRTNDQEALRDAVLAGAGLAVLPTWLIQDALESGRLQRVLAEFEGPRTPVYALIPNTGPPLNKVRAFVEFLSEQLRQRQILSSESLVRSEPAPLETHSFADR